MRLSANDLIIGHCNASRDARQIPLAGPHNAWLLLRAIKSNASVASFHFARQQQATFGRTADNGLPWMPTGRRWTCHCADQRSRVHTAMSPHQLSVRRPLNSGGMRDGPLKTSMP